MTKDHHVSGRMYVLTWLALMVLTAASFGFSHVEAGVWDAVVALTIATIKAGLVAAFFMHLLEYPFTSRMALLSAALFIVILCLFVVADVGYRKTFPPAPAPVPALASTPGS